MAQRTLVKTIALRGIRAKNEGPKPAAHFAVNYYVCATRTHTHIHTHTPNAQTFGSHVVTIYGLRCSGRVEREREERKRRVRRVRKRGFPLKE